MKFFLIGMIAALNLVRDTNTNTQEGCTSADLTQRKAFGKKLLVLVDIIDQSPMCMQMCKDVGACPVPAGENVKCNCFACSGFDAESYAKANDGVMDWDELLKHMDDMSMKWRDAIKGWHTTAGRFFF